jgi:hypothetical protein
MMLKTRRTSSKKYTLINADAGIAVTGASLISVNQR